MMDNLALFMRAYQEPHMRQMCSFEWGSEEGKRLRQAADDNKVRGNTALKQHHYEAALDLYHAGIKAATQVEDNHEQVAALYSNMSHVLSLMNNYAEALLHADTCISIHPSWAKGYFRKRRALVGLKRFQEAFAFGLSPYRMGLQLKYEEKVELFVESILLLPHIQDISSLTDTNISTGMWSDAIQRLTKQKGWESISILFLGRDNSEPILKSQTTKDVDLSGLLESCSVTEWRKWGQRLAVKLLQKGAKMESLDAQKKCGLHAAFQIGMKFGTYELLKHLFLHNVPMADRDRVDDDGNTLLHLACKGDYPTKLQAVELLLEHKVKPICRNKEDKKALDLVGSNDPERERIARAMERKGYSIADLTSQVGTIKPIADQQTPLSTGTAGPVSCEPVNQNYGKIFPAVSQHSNVQPSFLTSSVGHWTAEKVRQWALNNKIDEALQGLPGMDGKQLMELKVMQESSPHIFYQLLHNLKLSFMHILRVSCAVRQLHELT